MDENENEEIKLVAAVVRYICIGGVTVIALGMWGCPQYKVYSRTMEGKGEFQRAQQNRQIATLDAQAEVERAKGVAEANRIVADGLKGHDEYLRYLWIDKVAGRAQREVIYVPTEAGLPILEAGRTAAPKPE